MHFSKYLSVLERRLSSRNNRSTDLDLIMAAPMVAQNAFDRSTRRATGIYFTSQSIASKLAKLIAPLLAEESSICDPAVGAGDLLIACALQFPRGVSALQTLQLWSTKFSGFDKREQFIQAARLRLALLAKCLHDEPLTLSATQLDKLFPKLKRANFLSLRQEALQADVFITNPPFSRLAEAQPPSWRKNTSLAAIFLSRLAHETIDGTEIVGLFPEVIRCGTSYKSLRSRLTTKLATIHEESLGRFSPFADIDVFLAHYRRMGLSPSAATTSGLTSVVSDHFHVTTGLVVPHRDEPRGPWVRYITAKTLPAWHENFEPEHRRRHDRSMITPPFVAVRRTSAPSQRRRAVGSIVVGRLPIAVENHLIVLKPKDGTLASCRALLQMFQNPKINDALNGSMRCRHLTVGSLASLPFEKKPMKI